jgi:polyisoprenoid-binding protein YceI
MKKFFVPILSIIIFCTAFTLARSAISRSAISFKIKNLGINTNGTIGGLQADVHFNPADLSSSTLTASVDVNTLNTDNSSRDEHLKTEDFFDQAKYPRIILKSISFKHKSGNNYAGKFDLTIKDKTKEIEIPFACSDKGNSVAFNGSFKLNRLDFGIGGSSMIMADEVTVTIDAEVVK